METNPQPQPPMFNSLYDIEPFGDDEPLSREEQQLYNVGRPPVLAEAEAPYSTVSEPDPALLKGGKLMVRYEIMYAWKTGAGTTRTAFLAPGQAIPVFRSKGRTWEQTLRVEARAYALPMFDSEVYVMSNDEKVDYTDLPNISNHEKTQGTILCAPGGESRLRPHPRVPGMLPFKKYAGKTVNPQLQRNAMQVGDFVDLFGHMPLIPLESKRLPFSFCTGTEVDDQPFTAAGMHEVMSGQAEMENVAANVLTGRMLHDITPLDLPIAFSYAEDFLSKEAKFQDYDSAVCGYLKDHQIVYIRHEVYPYRDNKGIPASMDYLEDTESIRPFTHEELPPAAFLVDWKHKGVPDHSVSLSPGAYDTARKFRSGVYNPISA